MSPFLNIENESAPKRVQDTSVKSQVLQATQGQHKTIPALLLFIEFNSRAQTRQDLLLKERHNPAPNE